MSNIAIIVPTLNRINFVLRLITFYQFSVDDTVNAVLAIMNKPSSSVIPYSIYNVGSNKPNKLKVFLNFIEGSLKKKAKIKKMKLQQGDVMMTHADNNAIIKKTKIEFRIDIKTGIQNFISWYKEYYSDKKK